MDLAIRSGEFFGLLGPNGAGKSTTIGMLTTRVLPTAGNAFVAGIDVVRHPARVKNLIGVVHQTNTLDRTLSVAENLEFHGRYFRMSLRESRRRSQELLERFSLADRATAMVFELSGGLAQRLMIARALVHRPHILFLDEPTSGIDPQTRVNLWDILRGLHAEGQTILLTTHYMEEADALCEVATMEGEDIRAVSTEAAPGTMPASRASIAVEIGIVRATIMATAGAGMTAGSPVTTTATGTAAPMTVISCTATSGATPGMATAADTEAASPNEWKRAGPGPALVTRGIPGRVPAPSSASPPEWSCH